MRARERFVWGVLAAVAVGVRLDAAQTLDRQQLDRLEEVLRQEGQAVVALADASADGHPRGDFSLSWRNDFFKAQAGTFVPFVVGIGPDERRVSAALLYVRVARRAHDEGEGRGARRRPSIPAEGMSYPFEEIYPVEWSAPPGEPLRIARGFSIAPGDYDVTVVVRERDRGAARGRRRLAAVLRQPLSVPDYSAPGLTTSTVILADGLTVLREPPAAETLAERPYVIGTREVAPAADAVFRRHEELIVVFLVYNPTVTPDKHFDLEVEYHFFRKSRDGAGGPAGPRAGRPGPAAEPGEIYVNRTEPQRFTPLVLGPPFDPAAGQPVMAGQGVPLAGFQEGDYRLAIRVTDLISGRSIERHIVFSVRL
jgi:hypothetical protein